MSGMNSREELSTEIMGHLKITAIDYMDGKEARTVLVDKRNAVHKENMSVIIARSLGNFTNGGVFSMHFGHGGATVDSIGNITYAPVNVTGAADLISYSYDEILDPARGAPKGNGFSIRHVAGSNYTDLEILCVVDRNEPVGQPASDVIDQENINTSQYVFSEIALKSSDGLLLTHVVFAPVVKSANRAIEVSYVLRIAIN